MILGNTAPNSCSVRIMPCSDLRGCGISVLTREKQSPKGSRDHPELSHSLHNHYHSSQQVERCIILPCPLSWACPLVYDSPHCQQHLNRLMRPLAANRPHRPSPHSPTL